MSALTLDNFKWEDQPLPWQAVDGFDHGVGVAAGDIWRRLDYKSLRELTRLLRRATLDGRLKSTEAKVVNATTVDGKSRPTWVVSPRGLLKVSIYGNTPRLLQFHDALVAHLDALGSGDLVVMQRTEADALRAIPRLLGNLQADRNSTAAAIKELASVFGVALNVIKEERKREREADNFDAPKQGLIFQDPNAGDHDAAVLSVLVKYGAQARVRDIAKLAKLTIRDTERAVIRLRSKGLIERVGGKIDLKRGTDEQPTQIGGAS